MNPPTPPDDAASDAIELLPRWRLSRHVPLLVVLLEHCLPGSAARGRRVADLSVRIADRFDIPPRYRIEMDCIARIHELGHVISRSTDGPDRRGEAWRHAVNLRAVLRAAGETGDAADVAGSIYENWDGTGHPGHLVQGQIPLRSRVLRAAIDFVEKTESGQGVVEDVLAEMSDHGGTFYDPMVVVHLLEAAETDVSRMPRRFYIRRIAVPELEPGMVLAQDLHTEGGLKLLARGTVLTVTTLEAVRRRHRFDPIVGGVPIRQRAENRPERRA